MTDKQVLHLRSMLLDRRREVLDRVKSLESGWQELKPVAIELEEEAQKLSITEPFDRLDKEGKGEIELIDLALKKMAVGEYGICESCGEDISVRRLQAIPWARLCINCAREYERKNRVLPTPAEAAPSAELPDEYQGLSDEQIVRLIRERIEADGRLDTEELKIQLRDGVVYLEGVIAGVPEHQILMQIVTDVLGFSSVVDHLAINEVDWEREDRTPGTKAHGRTLADELFYDREELTEDLFVAKYQNNEKPYTPPEDPLPHQEPEPTG